MYVCCVLEVQSPSREGGLITVFDRGHMSAKPFHSMLTRMGTLIWEGLMHPPTPPPTSPSNPSFQMGMGEIVVDRFSNMAQMINVARVCVNAAAAKKVYRFTAFVKPFVCIRKEERRER